MDLANSLGAQLTFEFRTNRRDLLVELDQAVHTASPKSVVPVETHVLLDATFGPATIGVHSTNIENTFSSTFRARVAQPGKIALPTRKLHEYVKLLPDGEIIFSSTEEKSVTVKASRSRTRFTGIDPADFPERPAVPEPQLNIPANMLVGMINRTRMAVSSESSRYMLNCLQLAFTNSSTRMVSCDGNRLAVVEMASVSQNSLSLLIPRSAIDSVVALANCGAEDVSMSVCEKQVHFMNRSQTLTITRPYGSFPNYKAVIPSEQGREVVVLNAQLRCALDRTALFADSRMDQVNLSVHANKIEFMAMCPEFGNAKESIAVEYEGEDFSARYNATFIMDFLKVSESSPKITMTVRSAKAVLEMRPAERGPLMLRYIVMPCIG